MIRSKDIKNIILTYKELYDAYNFSLKEFEFYNAVRLSYNVKNQKNLHWTIIKDDRPYIKRRRTCENLKKFIAKIDCKT